MEFELLTENLELKLSPDFYIEDITYPTNTIMGVNVYSDGFCASTSMDIDIRELAVFLKNCARYMIRCPARRGLKNHMVCICICNL